MTLEEAQKIAEVISLADGGCGTCVKELCEALNQASLGFTWNIRKGYWENYDDPMVVVEPAKENPT